MVRGGLLGSSRRRRAKNPRGLSCHSALHGISLEPGAGRARPRPLRWATWSTQVPLSLPKWNSQPGPSIPIWTLYKGRARYSRRDLSNHGTVASGEYESLHPGREEQVLDFF